MATAKTKPSVLVIEVGCDAADIEHRVPYERFINAFKLTELDHRYSTCRQKAIDGKILPYPRGKGLGGTTLTNFMMYIKGPAADYDRWAQLVGSDDCGWSKTKDRFKKV